MPLRSVGTGPDAVVRLGTVLVSPKEEYHHFYREAAIFLYDMGQFYPETEEYILRGVILDHPTPFAVEEMIPALAHDTHLSTHKVFRGGDQGREDSVLLLHNQPSVGEEIGTDTGIFRGGWPPPTRDDVASSAVQAKVFFNYCEFTETQIEAYFAEGAGSDDPWMAVEVDPALVFHPDWDRGDCWRYLRNSIGQLRR